MLNLLFLKILKDHKCLNQKHQYKWKKLDYKLKECLDKEKLEVFIFSIIIGMFNIYGVPCTPSDDPSLLANEPGGGGGGEGGGSFNPDKV